MKRGRPLPELVLSQSENDQLVEWTRRHKTSQALALRSRIVLACAHKAINIEVAHCFASPNRPWASSTPAWRKGGWTDCWMNRVRAPRARWAMLGWNG